MTKGWGRAGAGLALVVAVVAGTVGCDGGDTVQDKPPASAVPKKASESVAQLWQEAWGDEVGSPCEEMAEEAAAKEAGCQNVIRDLVTDVRKVRKAMDADPAGADFYTEAYVIMDRIDALAGDMSDARLLRTRNLIRVAGVELNSWITSHPAR